MIVGNIDHSRSFEKQWLKLDLQLQKIAKAKIILFQHNPLHPSLRLHELHGSLEGKWSITVTKNYRIIFRRMPNGDILFLSIGKHDIYRNL